MSSTHVKAIACLTSPDAPTFASLPLPLAHRIFLALPVDERGRACCVCRAWRDVLADPLLWTRLDLSAVRLDDERYHAVLRGAAGRARSQLFQLDVSEDAVLIDELLPVLTANANCLRELHLEIVHLLDFDVNSARATVEAVVAAAPLLQVLTVVDVRCTWKDAPWMLRAEPPTAPLQMRRSLDVHFDVDGLLGGMERFGPFAAALADAALQRALLHVSIQYADTAQPALMGALVDSALARRLTQLVLSNCMPPAAAPLARLLAEGAIACFGFALPWPAFGIPLLDAAGAALVADALRVNTTLTKLDLCNAGLCRDMHADAQLVLGALVGHPNLRELLIYSERTVDVDCSAFGAALAPLIASDTPALQVLVCLGNRLGDAGLAPIVDALPLNRHLRELNLRGNDVSEAFARERLLPALRANTTLRAFECYDCFPVPAAVEAEELVRRRGQHG